MYNVVALSGVLKCLGQTDVTIGGIAAQDLAPWHRVSQNFERQQIYLPMRRTKITNHSRPPTHHGLRGAPAAIESSSSSVIPTTTIASADLLAVAFHNASSTAGSSLQGLLDTSITPKIHRSNSSAHRALLSWSYSNWGEELMSVDSN